MAGASEDVYRGVAVLRPGVDGHVGFREEHDGSNAVRRKGVSAQIEHGKPASLRCSDESVPDALGIIENGRIGNPELRDQVLAQTSLGHLVVCLHPPKTAEEPPRESRRP